MKPKLALAALLSTTVIIGGVWLSSASSAQAYPCKSSARHAEQHKQIDWFRSPLVAMIALPGIALAAALSMGNRHYRGN